MKGRKMAKYLVRWKFRTDALPDDPIEAKKVRAMLLSNIAKGMKEGIILDWGLSLDGLHGYGIRQMDGVELQKEILGIYQDVQEVDIQEVTSFEEAQKNMQAYKTKNVI